MTQWILAVLIFVPALSGAGVCPPIAAERKALLCRYVQRKYRLADELRPSIVDISAIKGGCYRKLRFIASGKRDFDITLVLTPDQRFLVPEHYCPN